ncbi:MAG: metallophosphoesterase [Acidobacteriaceae bacterium]
MSPFSPFGRKPVTRRAFLGMAGAAAAGLALYPTEIERHELDVVLVPLKLRNLPDSFRGMRIAQISDIHFDEFTEPFFVRRTVEKVNSLKPDMVLLTGDYISDAPLPAHDAIQHIGPCAEILGGIDCPLRFSILGNHDANVSAPGVTEALQSHNIPVLANRYMPIERDGKRIWIAGVEDPGTQSPDLSKAIPPSARADGENVILLSHAPDYADNVVGHGVDLVLSGHTHGGQIRIPFIPPIRLPELGRKYVQGHFQLGAMQLYVNRGIGTVGVPMRFLCPPEITLITLV